VSDPDYSPIPSTKPIRVPKPEHICNYRRTMHEPAELPFLTITYCTNQPLNKKD